MIRFLLAYLLLIGYVFNTSQSRDQELNNRPIIGILAQHFHPDDPFPVPGDCYISASYVKYLESAGARIVPIKINQEPEVIEKLLSSVNGVLFPGGDSDVMNSPFQRNAKMAFEYAVSQRNAGKYFPIWGTCMGFQQLSVLAAQSNVLSASNGTWDAPMKLPDLDRNGRMIHDMSDELFDAVKFEPLTYNAHYNCVSMDSYKKNENLQNFFKILSTNVDNNGKTFISTMEGIIFLFLTFSFFP